MLRSRPALRARGYSAGPIPAFLLDLLTTTSLPPRITFSRGSQAMVTDATGKLTYAPNNLLTNSESFEAAAWAKINAAITANTVAAPDGTTTADTITTTTTNGQHTVESASVVIVGVTYVASVYVKANGSRYFTITNQGSALYGACFDLQTGTLAITAGANVTATSITSVGDGWYRVSVTSAFGFGKISFAINNSASNGFVNYAGDGTSGIYLWGAQLEAVTYQTTPSPYVSTTPKNLLGFSEAFDNAAWTKTASSIVTGAAANPVNGLFNAQKLMEDTSTAGHQTTQGATTTANPFTYSVYVKAAGRNWVALGITDSTSTVRITYFDLVNGVLGTVATGITASVTSVGNGWYRCAVTVAASLAGSTTCRIYISPSNNAASYTGDGTSGIYIWGAQLSNSASVDPYVYNPVAAPSSTAYYGPRFDYDPVTLAPRGLLIEEQRANLLTYSEQFNNAVWANPNGTVEANTTLAPDGTSTADNWKLNSGVALTIAAAGLFTGAAGAARLATSYTSTLSAVPYTYSLYVKANTGLSHIQLRISTNFTLSGGTSFTTIVKLSDGSVVNSDGVTTVTDAGNGWYRVALTVTATAAAYFAGVWAWNATSKTTNGTEGIYIWGAQLEAGSFATSYIPTVASTVTRSADVALMQGANFSNWYNQSEGTVVSAFSSFTPTGVSQAAWTISDGTNNERWFVFCPSTAIRHFMVDGGVTQVSIDVGTYATNSVFKSAMAIRLNSVQAAVNGVLGTEDTNATIPTVDRLGFGTAPSAATGFLNGHIRSIQYYNTRLPNAQLQALTQ